MRAWLNVSMSVALGAAAACAKQADPPSAAASGMIAVVTDASPVAPLAPAGATARDVADAAPPVDECDELVAQVGDHQVGLMKIEGALRDPLCRWRVDDADDEALRKSKLFGSGSADDLAAAGAQRATHSYSAGSSGFRSSGPVLAKIRSLEPSLKKCVADGRTVLRVRIRVLPDGTSDLVLTDYRQPLSEPVRTCVVGALQALTFPKVSDRDSTIFEVHVPMGR
jgi:hypothetical protein